MSAKPTPINKVAVLRIPADVWASMPAQEQLLFAMQQMLGFMASPQFADMEGVQIVAFDMHNIAASKTVLRIGAEPTASGIIQPN